MFLAHQVRQLYGTKIYSIIAYTSIDCDIEKRVKYSQAQNRFRTYPPVSIAIIGDLQQALLA